MKEMHPYIIYPQAPLVFKSGRPFGTGGKDGANFPWPSSLAGMMRTCVMQDNGWLRVDPARKQELLSLAVQGPLLLRIARGEEPEVLVPRPLDSIYIQDENTKKKQVCRLAPAALPEGCHCDLPAGLLPVQLLKPHKTKPQAGPEYWPLSKLLAWQSWPRGEAIEFDFLYKESLAIDSRTHVAIDNASYASKDGALFQIQGLDFAPCREGEERSFSGVEFALAGRFSRELSPRMATFGGKRRLIWLEKAAESIFSCPAGHLPMISQGRGLVLTLATPALFQDGWKPGWIKDDWTGCPPECGGLRLKLKAAAVGRWQGVSGWDLQEQRPKSARKAVPPGSVYWFEILSDTGFDWSRLWLTSISDRQQDQMDGFGMVVPGPWQWKN